MAPRPEPGNLRPSAPDGRVDAVVLRTPMAFDPLLIDQLERINEQLLDSYNVGVTALAQSSFDAAAAAFELCREDMQRLHWIEALSIFPPLVNRSAVDESTGALVSRARDTANAGVAAICQLTGELATACRAHRVPAVDPVQARAELTGYLEQKRRNVYPLYFALMQSTSG